MAYPCPCCGYQTLTAEPPGTYQLCPICFWEDDGNTVGNDGAAGSNQVSLRQAQRNFVALGACEPQWLGDVRPPSASDYRDPYWQTLDAQAEAMRQDLIVEIRAAFNDVSLGNGTTIHEAYAKDAHQETAPARQIDCDLPWQEIPDAWIEHFGWFIFSHMNAKGLRHALPAYVLWCLRHGKTDYTAYASTVAELKPTQRRADLLAILDARQTKALSDFYDYVVTYVESFCD